MVCGEVGLLGLLVEVIVRNQDPEVVIIQLLQMEETPVLVLVKVPHHVLEVSVHQHMDHGEVGLPGHLVKETARDTDTDFVIIQLQQMVGIHVLVLVKNIPYAFLSSSNQHNVPKILGP